jgi:branched-chain amino acid transport system ATP-binding protein
MLDEPSLGLSPILVRQLFDLIKELNNEGISILIVEQNTKLALKTAQ